MGIRKTPTRKIPTHTTPPWKIPIQKIPTWNIPTHGICPLWIENSKMNGLKGCKKYQEKSIFHFLYLKESWLKKMNGICLTNQVRSGMLRYTSQIAEETSFFSVILFRAWFYDKQFSKTKCNLLKMLEESQEHIRAMLVKMQSFIP